MTDDSSDNRLFLRRIHIDNYKCLSNFELSFGDLTLLLGKNGCGKSAIFEAIDAMHRLLCQGAQIRELFPPDTRTIWNNNDEQSFELEAGNQKGDVVYRYRLVVQHESPDYKKERIIRETLDLNDNPLFGFVDGDVQLYYDNHEEGPKFSADWSKSSGIASIINPDKNKKLQGFLKWMDGVSMLRLNPFNIESTSPADSSYLHTDGGNFASWYRGITQENPDQISEVREKLENILPGYGGLRLVKSGELHRDLEAKFAKHNYAFNKLSAGQRVLIVLYMLIFCGDKNLLLLDEPDNFIMLPEVRPMIAEILDEAVHELPQITLISHHPEAMDFIPAENSRWLEREPKSFTRIKDFQNDTRLTVSELYARGMAP